MDGEISDNVKYEKAKAIARFNQFRRITKLWQVFEVVIVLVFLSWCSTSIPAALKLSGEFLLRASACLLNPHVVFLIGNTIIVALFVLGKRNGDAGSVSRDASGDGDLYDEYVRHSEAQRRVAPTTTEEIKSAVEDDGGEAEEEKRLQIVVSGQPEGQCEDEVEPAVAEAQKQIRRFQRTQSARLRREIAVVRPRRELRRTETGLRRRETSSFDAVDALSKEEFKRAVDAFIDKHQRFFKEQKMAELEGLNYNNNKITV